MGREADGGDWRERADPHQVPSEDEVWWALLWALNITPARDLPAAIASLLVPLVPPAQRRMVIDLCRLVRRKSKQRGGKS